MILFRNIAIAVGLLVLPSVAMAQVNPPVLEQSGRSIQKSTTAPTKAVHSTRRAKSKRARVHHVTHRTTHHTKRAATPRMAPTQG